MCARSTASRRWRSGGLRTEPCGLMRYASINTCATRVVRGFRALDLIELLCIVPQNLSPYRFFAIGESAPDALVHLLAIERGRMRKIGFEHDIVRADLVDKTPGRDLFEPVTRVDVTGEILGRQQIELGTLFAHAIAEELVIHGLKHKRYPSDTTLDRHEFDGWITVQHTGHDQIAHLPAVLQKDVDRERGERRREPVTRHAILEQSFRHVTRSDVKTDRQIELTGDLPERIPARVAQQRLTEILRLAGKEDSAMAHGRTATYFRGGGPNVPEGNRGDRQQAARIG